MGKLFFTPSTDKVKLTLYGIRLKDGVSVPIFETDIEIPEDTFNLILDVKDKQREDKQT